RGGVVAGGGGVGRRGGRRLPQQRAGRLVEGAELPIVIRGRDEHEAAGGDEGTAVVLAARVFQPLRDELGIFAERHFPGVLASVEIDRVERAPRRRHRGISLRVEELLVAGEAVCVVDERMGWRAATAARRRRRVFTRD